MGSLGYIYTDNLRFKLDGEQPTITYLPKAVTLPGASFNELLVPIKDAENNVQNVLRRLCSATAQPFVPLATSIHEWLMDLAGSRPWLIKPVAFLPRDLLLGFEIGKVFLFVIVIELALQGISREV